MTALTHGVDRHGWMPIASGVMPNTNRDVLVWDKAEQQAATAFFAEGDNCWVSKYDGSPLDDGTVTHWREIQAPEGVIA